MYNNCKMFNKSAIKWQCNLIESVSGVVITLNGSYTLDGFMFSSFTTQTLATIKRKNVEKIRHKMQYKNHWNRLKRTKVPGSRESVLLSSKSTGHWICIEMGNNSMTIVFSHLVGHSKCIHKMDNRILNKLKKK